MPDNDDDETVASILLRKLGKIKYAPLPKGAPSWDEIAGETWRDIKRKARRRQRGYGTFKKLLTDVRFDK
jgi:hypothetical protein